MARPEFSEASFAFAITHNIIEGMPGVTGVPTFPSRWAEGQAGGGFDVQVPRRMGALFLQYKVPEVLTRRSHLIPPGFSCPYYRFSLRTGLPNQHQALRNHEALGRSVYYALPRFHDAYTLNELFQNGTILSRSRFFRPHDIGPLHGEGHFVAYHPGLQDWWVFSEPERRVSPTTFESFQADIEAKFQEAEPVLPEPFFTQIVEELQDSLPEAYQAPIYLNALTDADPVIAIAVRAASLSRVVLGAELAIIQDVLMEPVGE